MSFKIEMKERVETFGNKPATAFLPTCLAPSQTNGMRLGFSDRERNCITVWF